MIFLSGCQEGDSSIKWVDLWASPSGTCKTEIVRTSLYDYDPQGRRDGGSYQFKITDAPPLRFAFSAAYYMLNSNINGGPQASIRLFVTQTGWQPFMPSSKSCGGSTKNGDYSKGMPVTIYSNVLGGMIDLDPNWKSIDYSSRTYFRGMNVTPMGTFGSFDMFAYDTVSMGTKPLAVVNGSPNLSDLSSASFFGYARNYGSSVVKKIECDNRGPTCVLGLFYKRRGVSIVIPKGLAAQAERLGIEAVAFLDRHNEDVAHQ